MRTILVLLGLVLSYSSHAVPALPVSEVAPAYLHYRASLADPENHGEM